MQATTTIGLDIAKSVFQVHGIDAAGNVILRRQLKRRYVLMFFQKLQPCLVGIEACASSHYWSRELAALGHTVRLMPAAYVKPYVKRHKTGGSSVPATGCLRWFSAVPKKRAAGTSIGSRNASRPAFTGATSSPRWQPCWRAASRRRASRAAIV